VNGDESAGRSEDDVVSSGGISGWGGVSSVPISISDGAVCEGTGSGMSSAYGSADSWAGSWERAGVFSDDGDSNDGGASAGRTGSAGRLAASAKGFCKTNSTASLACGSVAISIDSTGGVSVDAGNSTGVGVSSSARFAVGSSSPGSKIGMSRSAVPLVSKPAIG